MAIDSPVQRDGDQGFLGFASRLNPLTLPPGMLQDSVNMRLERGTAQTRKGAKRLADAISTTDTPLALSFDLAADKNISTITRSGTLATVTTTAAHGYTNGNQVNIRGAEAPNAALYNGDFVISAAGGSSFQYTMTGTPTADATGTLFANKGPIVKTTYGGGIFASGVFASRNYENAAEYIVMCGPSSAFLWRNTPSGDEVETLVYPNSPDETIEPTDNVSVVQAFDRLYILREAEQTPDTEWANRLLGVDPGVFTVTIASPGVVTKTAHGLENTMAVTLSTTGALPTGLVAGTIYYVINKTANTFQLAATSGGVAINTSGSQSGVHSLTPVSAAVSSTTATIFCKNHPYLAGQRVRLEAGGPAAFNGHEFDVLGGADAPTTHTFRVTVPNLTANDTASSATRATRRVKPPIYWTGTGSFVRAAGGVPAEGATYRKMRSVGWASYIQNRLIIPDGRDQVAISDYLDADLYDPFYQSFRAGAGGSDYIVAVHPWVEGSALVFARKSIWLATLGQLPSTDGASFAIDTAVAKLELITDEIGCSARNSIATAGRYVFFLSDAGVYRLDTQLDLKLRGDTKPLSDPVADQFERIDQSKVHRAFGLWHNNRYTLAVPTIDSPDETNDLVITYSALNDQWESRDIYGIGVDALIVGTYSDVRRVFNVRRTGSLFLLDEKDDGTDDEPSGSNVGLVVGTIRTRRYNMGNMHSKRFTRALSDVVLPSAGSITVEAELFNPDAPVTLVPGQSNDTGAEEDYTLKQPIRRKAHAAELIFQTNLQRPEIRNVSIEAALEGLPQTDTRNAA
jgi:hypothetical protein